jgi:predicted Zn-dependent protease
LPVHPRESTEVDPTGSRPSTVHVAVVSDPQYVLQVSEESVADAPADAKVYDYLHNAARHLEQTANVTHVSETRVPHEGKPAIQTTATASGWQVDAAVVYAGGRLFRISVRTRSDGPDVLARVMRSFHVTNAA